MEKVSDTKAPDTKKKRWKKPVGIDVRIETTEIGLCGQNTIASLHEGDFFSCFIPNGKEYKQVCGIIQILEFDKDKIIIEQPNGGGYQVIPRNKIYEPLKVVHKYEYGPDIVAAAQSAIKRILRGKSTQKELDLFVTAFLEGIKAQQAYGYLTLSQNDCDKVTECFNGMLLKPFYFTFNGKGEGRNRQPYKDGYCIVMAENIHNAVIAFRNHYPSKGNTQRFAAAYNEARWKYVEKAYSHMAAHETFQ